MSQLALALGLPELAPKPEISLPHEDNVYKYPICCSGGKDSVALTLWAMANLPQHKLELVHHRIDGIGDNFFDYPITDAYVSALAKHLGIPLYFSWLDGGIHGEMHRTNAARRPTFYETAEEGLKSSGGHSNKLSTRRKFPAKTMDLRTRWCSGALKIDVCRASIAGQSRFTDKTIVVLTGERREESSARNKYATTVEYLQPTKRGRHVYQHRPLLDYSEQQVWDALKAARIIPHPAYNWGAPRLSCRMCIFADPSHMATVRRDFPTAFDRIAATEVDFAHTIDNHCDINTYANRGTPYPHQPELAALLDSPTWDRPIVTDNWQLPQGAFGNHLSGSP
jgi:3'-phosphoadenosine 5'-phosphosulfate sulfotransferase (PAPS reductase)/FAD synthetase